MPDKVLHPIPWFLLWRDDADTNSLIKKDYVICP